MEGEELTVDGVRYVSSRLASDISGYAQDYIGQLCRDGKLDSRRVGRSWYIRKGSLLSYIGDSMEAAFVAQDVRDTQAKSIDLSTNPMNAEEKEPEIVDVSVDESPDATYAEEHAPRTDVGDKTQVSYTNEREEEHMFRGLLVPMLGVSIVAIVLVLVGLMIDGSEKLSLNKVHSPYNGAAQMASAFGDAEVPVDPPEHMAYSKIPFFMAGYAMLTSYADTVEDQYEDRGGVLGVLSTTTSGYVSDTINNSGIIVTPSQGAAKDRLLISEIQNSFSDEVIVTPSADGGAGIIKPIFKNKRGEDYLYILVPLEESQ